MAINRGTQLLTPFKALGDNRADVIAKTRMLNARADNPIVLVLELAANELKAEKETASHVVVLVSDGRETCKGHLE